MARDENLPPLDLDRIYGIAPLTAGSAMSRAEYGLWLEGHLWRPSRVTGLEVADDVGAASWVGESLHPGTFQVWMTAPDGFEAYARLFFPFVGDSVVVDGRPVDNERITWTEMAARSGKTGHALMEAETISATDERQTVYNCFSDDQEHALWPILDRHTASTHAWFLLWDGFGGIDPRPFQNKPRVEHPGRSYHLLHGPLSARAAFQNAPSYIWPEDRTWCLCTDVDFYWAYVAGSAGCVEEILATPILDAYSTQPTNAARSGMDIINDPPGTVPRNP